MLDKIKLKLIDDKYLDNNGYISNDYKFKLNFPEFNIKDSIIIGKPEEKFETKLFLPIGEGRKGEGGLRTKGFFKFSYKYVNNTWMIVDYYGNSLTKVPDEIDAKINEYIQLTENIAIKELPLITVITVVYNGDKYLEQTIQSVINQTYPNVEYIIIDGGSTDGTIDLIKKYEDYIDYWVSEKDKGIYDAMNKGKDLALGCFINYMNNKDLFIDSNIFNYFYNINHKYDLIYGNVVIDNKGKKIIKPRSLNAIYRLKMPFCHQTVFLKNSIFRKYSFNIKYKIAADFDLFFKILSIKKYNYFYLNKPICIYDINGVSSNSLYTIYEYLLIGSKNKINIIYFIINILYFYFIFVKSTLIKYIKKI